VHVCLSNATLFAGSNEVSIKLGMQTATTSSGRRLESGHLFLRQSLERYSVAYSTSFKHSATYLAGSGLTSFHVKSLAFQTRTSCTTAPLDVRLELRPPLFSQRSPFMQERYPEIPGISFLGRYEAKFALALEVACLYRYPDWCILSRFTGGAYRHEGN